MGIFGVISLLRYSKPYQVKVGSAIALLLTTNRLSKPITRRTGLPILQITSASQHPNPAAIPLLVSTHMSLTTNDELSDSYCCQLIPYKSTRYSLSEILGCGKS